MPTKKINDTPTTITDLKPDRHNRRRRTTRGEKMLVESLEQLGAARSIVIDETNEVLAGNGVVEAAAAAGITKVQVVEADGKTLVAVRRSGLTPDEKRALAMYDNRTGELGEWVPEQLAEDQHGGLGLAPWFDEKESAKLLKTGNDTGTSKVRELEVTPVKDKFWIAVRGPLKDQAKALQKLRELLKEQTDVTVELGLAPEQEAWTG